MNKKNMKNKSLKSSSELMGYCLVNFDNNKKIGKCQDFLIDDEIWNVRYMVAETRKWPCYDKVLVSPIALEDPDWEAREIAISINEDQLQRSPPIKVDPPVCEKNKTDLMSYFRPSYWPLQIAWGGDLRQGKNVKSHLHDQIKLIKDGFLRSAREVIGYSVSLEDAKKGHIEDFIFDTMTWDVKFVVIDTRNWVPGGKKVLVKTDLIESVSWLDKFVYINLKEENLEKKKEVQLLSSGNWSIK